MKLLVPSNFSKIANSALKTASDLCIKLGNSSIIVVHFVESDQDQVIPFGEYDKLPNIQEVFEQQLSKSLFPHVEAYFILYSSESSLYKLIDSFGADLVVMGTNEVDRYEDERLIGKHTKTSIKNLHTPILCLRDELKDLNFGKVVFTTNFKAEQLEDFNMLSPVLAALDLEVEVLMISSPDKFITSQRAELLFAESTKVITYKKLKFVHYNEIGTVEGIVGYCKSKDVDLLILPTQGRKGFAHFFNGSIAESVLDQVRIPVISILE